MDMNYRMKRVILCLFCTAWVQIASAAQIVPLSVTIEGETKDVGEGSKPLFIDVKPSSGPLGAEYQFGLMMKNSGDDIEITDVTVRLYSGSFEKEVPANASILQIQPSNIKSNLPSLKQDEEWPNGGIQFLVSGNSIPETVACSPYDITIDVEIEYILKGEDAVERDLVPLQVIPKCLSVTPAEDSPSVAVKISSSSECAQTNDKKLSFLIDFGTKMLEINPLKLFTLTGTNRSDIVYSVEEGKIYVMAYPEDVDAVANISIAVNSGVATDASGTPNDAASLVLQYVPEYGAYRDAALVLTGVFAATILVSWGTSFIVSSVQPWATAGSLGYGAIAFILWAQRFYLSGEINTYVMPANYRTMTNVFAWANFQAPLPWNWGSETEYYGISPNLTEMNAIFEERAVVLLDSRTKDFAYYFESSDEFSLPPSEAPSPPQVAISPPIVVQEPVVESIPSPPAQESVPEPKPVPSPPAVPQPGELTPGQDSCSVLQNTDFFGGDLDNKSFKTADPQECCNACLGDPSCFVWTLSFVDNKCYMKGKTGWQQLGGRTCCLSGTANRGGISPIKLPGSANDNQNNNNNNQNNNNNNQNNNNNNQNNNNNNENRNRKLLWTRGSSRALLQASSTVLGPENIRYVVVSTNDHLDTSQTLVTITGEEAGGKVKYVVNSASPGTEENYVYDGIERAAFWLACLLALATLINLSAFTLVKCCEGEIPGVLFMPRMLLIVLLISLTGFCYSGSVLYSQADSIVPIVIGIVIIIFFPALFLVACYVGIAAAVYRKRKAVYLLSSRSSAAEEVEENSKWDKRVVAEWMGMSLNRGKWRAPDPSKKNEFVFRWGPLFEDCRGPLYQRKKIDMNSSIPLRRAHASSASDQSSQSGAQVDSTMPGMRRSSRKKVAVIEEKPIGRCCGTNAKRSNFQTYGIVMSFIRMSVYGILIGSLDKWPAAQAGSCLGLSVLYLVYLRFAVPYSRRDEMALEYWVALLDIIIFSLLLALDLSIGDNDFNGMDTFCIVLLVFQGLGMLSYLINRVLIVIHAFAEVVCPACSCGAPSPKKDSKRRSKHRKSRSGGSAFSRSESLTYSASDTSIGMSQQFFADGKGYYAHGSGDGKDIDSISGPHDTPTSENENGYAYAAPPQVNSMVEGRSVSRSGKSGMFPAIIEEENDLQNSESHHTVNPGESSQQKRGQNAVFDKFWRSL